VGGKHKLMQPKPPKEHSKRKGDQQDGVPEEVELQSALSSASIGATELTRGRLIS